MPIPQKKPESVLILYGQDGPLYHDGRVPKLEGGYLFTKDVPVEVKAVPLDEYGRVLPFAREDEAVAWDDGDIVFFRHKAETNPGTWNVVDGKGRLISKAVSAVKEAVDTKMKRKGGGV